MTLLNDIRSISFDRRAVSLFQPDALAAHQYLQTVRKRDRLVPEEELMLAVLEDALFCFRKYLFARDKKGKAIFRETADWIIEEDSDWIFSFENICEFLRLSPSCIRAALLRCKEQKLARCWRGGEA
jgi:hypothetical protein